MLKEVTKELEEKYTIRPCPFCKHSGRIFMRSDKRYFAVCSNTKNCPGYNIRTRSYANPIDALFAWNNAWGC